MQNTWYWSTMLCVTILAQCTNAPSFVIVSIAQRFLALAIIEEYLPGGALVQVWIQLAGHPMQRNVNTEELYILIPTNLDVSVMALHQVNITNLLKQISWNQHKKHKKDIFPRYLSSSSSHWRNINNYHTEW